MNINIRSTKGVFMSDSLFADGIKCRMHRYHKGLTSIDKLWSGRAIAVLKVLGV